MKLMSEVDWRPYRPGKRWVWVVFFICALSMTGCVYLRLLAIKNQLARFDQYFRVEASDSFTLHFLEPKLFGKDVEYLSELQPTVKKPTGDGEEWTFLFKKMRSETEESSEAETDIFFVFRFNREGLLTSLTFSPILVRIAPPEFLELSLRSLGNADVDKKKRQIAGNLENLAKIKKPLPHREEILRYLGEPISEEPAEDALLTTYHYRLDTEVKSPEQEKRRLSTARLYFDPKTHELMRFFGRFSGMKISINYRKLVDEKYALTDAGKE